MKTYEIPITWQSYKTYSIEAENLEEAVKTALKQFLSEPDDNYLEDSFDIDTILEDNYPDEEYSISKIVEDL